MRVSAGAFERTIGSGTFDVVLADRCFSSRLANTNMPIVWIDAVEERKSLAGIEQLIAELVTAGVPRDAHLLAVGGGIVQDMATFVASVYMRGIAWTYVPTTLMAMADSCIGGKSSINAGGVKNVVGNIYPPQAITVDPEFLATLSTEDLVSGLGEAVKICFCRGEDALVAYLAHFQEFGSSPDADAALIYEALAAKQWFIEVDEFDREERRQLNFGHTFGHALEAATGFTVPHGVAVTIGMLASIEFARAQSGRVPPEVGVLSEHCHQLLKRLDGYPEKLASLDDARFRKAFASDKKHGRDSYRVILPGPDGVAEVTLARTAATVDRAVDALHEAIGSAWRAAEVANR